MAKNIKITVLFILTGAESKVPVGMLEVKLELLPAPGQQIAEEVISTQV